MRQRLSTLARFGFPVETREGQWVMSETAPVIWRRFGPFVSARVTGGEAFRLVAFALMPARYLRLVALEWDEVEE